MRVLYINHSAAIGGAETNLLEMLRHASTVDLEPVGLLVPQNGPLVTEATKLGIPNGVISYHAFRWRNPKNYIRTIGQMIAWIRRVQPAAIHLNHQWLVSHVVQAGLLTKTPVICQTRNLLDAAFVTSQGRWLDRANAIVVESRAVEQRAHELGLRQTHIHLIYNGIDADRFRCDRQSDENSPHNSFQKRRIVIGFSGRLVPEKGPEDLIRAVPDVLKCAPNTEFHFLGADHTNGTFVSSLRRTAALLGVEGSIHFLGFRSDTSEVLRTFDMLAIPSRRSMPEGLPLTALEGLAAGCIVVATPNSGIPEVIQDNQTGFLVPPEDPAALANVLCLALQLPDAAMQRIRATGIELVTRQFSIERQMEQLKTLYWESTA